ncbi:hypothetical protein [Pseudoduganella umbonata]|jgi:hypothetical protein|uniref:Uncharacterized protein n=1 Tax=Pseudoduganella umbonata TaxID=864828 RepID=A0A4P8HS44_9BURK|nr:hypothetical protein [Pseudoduganella umbonata]MBB3223903.1 hypothetical protein [Pseudoduganella umbonata]QCP12689.1 hypothetical protein FCL38_21290 [Pseudoduganella umbonata]
MSSRSTRASNAIDRLKQRSGNPGWSMSITGSGHFFLTEGPGKPPLCPPMELDEFVAFVNAQGPQVAKRISKNDVEFEKQLTKKPPKA